MTDTTQVITLWVENGVYGWHKKEFNSFTELADYLLSDLSIKCQARKTVIYSITHPQKKIATTTAVNGDYQELVNILKNRMNLSAREAKEATDYAMQNASDMNLEGKLRTALQYQGRSGN